MMNNDSDGQALLSHHSDNHFTAGDIVRDIIIALAAALSGANATFSIVLTAGIAEVPPSPWALEGSRCLAAKSEADHYMREMQREEEIIALPDSEAAEVAEILANYGVEAHEYGALVRNPQAWLEFMMKFGLGLEKPDPRRAMRSAITIAVSYMLMERAREALLALLFVFAKAFFTADKPPLKSAIQTVLIDAIASASASAFPFPNFSTLDSKF